MALDPKVDVTRVPAPFTLSVAPMMDRTDRHFRVLMRQISRRCLLYSEMVTTHAILRGDRHQLLDFDPVEPPVALQLGGDDPRQLRQCARIAEDWGYDEVNLNVGCPSDRVQQGHFGACLMARPQHVAECVAAMRAEVQIPVTVKHRIGINEPPLDRYEDLRHFAQTVVAAGADRLIVHARIAVLGGLSPKDNRRIPPLRYDDVHRLKRELPAAQIEINGGISTLDQVVEQLHHVDGVMIGRAAYDNPFVFAKADRRVFGDARPSATRRQVVENMIPYLQRWTAQGGAPHHTTRHMLTLFVGQPGTKRWKQRLSGAREQPSAELLRRALQEVPPTVLDRVS